jgi:hypothetical protein
MAPARKQAQGAKQTQAASNTKPSASQTQITAAKTAARQYEAETAAWQYEYEAFPLDDILVYNTPVTINYYDPRLAHLARPRRCVTNGKVVIYRVGIPDDGHRLAGLSVDHHSDVTVNLMYPNYDRYAERAWTEPVPCDRGVRMNYVWVPVPPEVLLLEESGPAQDSKRDPAPRRGRKEEGCGCSIL